MESGDQEKLQSGEEGVEVIVEELSEDSLQVT